MPKTRTNEEFFDDMKRIHPDFVLSGVYVNCKSIMHVIHNKCNYEWDTSAETLYYHGCPKCGHSLKITQDDFEQEVLIGNSNITVLGKYNGRKNKILVRNNKCGHEYEALPHNISNGHGCPICDGKMVLSGFNDIATTHPDFVKYFSNKEDAYTHTAGCHDDVSMICPNCGKEITKNIKAVIQQGFSCPYCSDTISYPNKFLRALLNYLPVENINYEYSPEWLGKKRFDAYFEYQNNKYAVEMDGNFHYKDLKFSDPLENVCSRDKEKDELATLHDIHVIRIDSRKSTVEYISNNILKSELSTIFDLSIVDWKECGRFASSNLLKLFCDYYMKNRFDLTFQQIADHFKISIYTFYTFKKNGILFGWIDEDDEVKSLLRALNSGFEKGVRIIALDSNKNIIREFPSCLSCAKYMSYIYGRQFSVSSIKNRIRDEEEKIYNGFYFKML